MFPSRGSPFGSPSTKFAGSPKINLKIITPATSEITIANTDIKDENPPDVFFLLLIILNLIFNDLI
jgi:hypothetical protein